MGWRTPVTATSTVIIYGAFGGEFRYAGFPAAGNLLYSNSNLTGLADPTHLNYVLPGEVTYFNTGAGYVATQITANGIQFLTAPSYNVAYTSDAQIAYLSGSIPQALRILIGPGKVLQLSESLYLYDASGDPTGATDSGVLGDLLGASGVTVMLTDNANYALSGPLTIADQSCLTALNPSWGIPTGNYGAGGLPLQGSILTAGTSFAGAEMISIGSVGTVQHGGQRLYGLTVDARAAPAGTHGILLTGYVGGVKARDVLVDGAPGTGLRIVNDGTSTHTSDFHQWDACKFSNCGLDGVLTQGFSDSWFTDTEATGNNTANTGAGNWNITGGTDTRLTNCRGDSAQGTAGYGISLTPTGTGRVSLNNFEANNNSGIGYVFNTGTVMDYFLNGCIQSGNTTAPYSYAAGARVHSDGGNFTVWRPLTPANGWVNSGLGPVCQIAYRGSSVELVADLTAGTLVAGTTIINLPAPAQPNNQQFLPLLDITTKTAQAQLTINPAGTVNFQPAIGVVAAGDRCFVEGRFSLDA